MKPKPETIERFRQAYKDEFNEEISSDQAYEKFLRVVNFLRVTLKQDSSKDRSQLD